MRTNLEPGVALVMPSRRNHPRSYLNVNNIITRWEIGKIYRRSERYSLASVPYPRLQSRQRMAFIAHVLTAAAIMLCEEADR